MPLFSMKPESEFQRARPSCQRVQTPCLRDCLAKRDNRAKPQAHRAKLQPKLVRSAWTVKHAWGITRAAKTPCRASTAARPSAVIISTAATQCSHHQRHIRWCSQNPRKAVAGSQDELRRHVFSFFVHCGAHLSGIPPPAGPPPGVPARARTR